MVHGTARPPPCPHAPPHVPQEAGARTELAQRADLVRFVEEEETALRRALAAKMMDWYARCRAPCLGLGPMGGGGAADPQLCISVAYPQASSCLMFCDRKVPMVL